MTRALSGVASPGRAMRLAYVASGLLIGGFGLPRQHPLWICELVEQLTNDSAGDATVAFATKLIFLVGWMAVGGISIVVIRLLKHMAKTGP